MSPGSPFTNYLMKKIVFILFLFVSSAAFAAGPIDIFRTGLEAYRANGADALLRTWYNTDEEAKVNKIRANLTAITANLGPAIDTEVFVPKQVGSRLTRLYGVIYFQKRPLWFRADYYTAEGAGGFLSLEFSLIPEEILPLEIGISAGK